MNFPYKTPVPLPGKATWPHQVHYDSHAMPRWNTAICDKCGYRWAVHDWDIKHGWKPPKADCAISPIVHKKNLDAAADQAAASFVEGL